MSQPSNLVMWCSIGLVVGVGGLVLVAVALLADRSRGRRRCPRCWYDRSGGTDGPCPECGHAATTERALLRTRIHWRWVTCGAILMAGGTTTAVFSVLGASDPWSLAPDWLVIHALPWHQTGREPLAKQFSRRLHRYLPQDPRYPGSYSGPPTIYSELITLHTRVKGGLSARQERQLAEQALRALERSPTHPFRETLLSSLTVLPADPARMERLLVALLDDPSWKMRGYAIRALGRSRINPKRIVPILVRRTEELVWPTRTIPSAPAPGTGWDDLSNEAEAALLVEAIGFYGSDAAEAVPQLVRLLKANSADDDGYGVNGEMDRYVCDALMRIGPAAAAALPALVHSHPDPGWGGYEFIGRLEAALVLSGAARDKTDALIQLTRHESWRVRRTAIRHLLNEAPDPSVHKDTGLAMLRDESDHVSISAAKLMLAAGMAREECRDFLLKPPDEGGAGDAWSKVQILQRHGFNASTLVPQLEVEKARAEQAAYRNPVVLENYQRMIDALRAGKQYR